MVQPTTHSKINKYINTAKYKIKDYLQNQSEHMSIFHSHESEKEQSFWNKKINIMMK